MRRAEKGTIISRMDLGTGVVPVRLTLADGATEAEQKAWDAFLSVVREGVPVSLGAKQEPEKSSGPG